MKIKFSALVDDAGKDGNLMIRCSRSGPVAAPRRAGDDGQTGRRTLIRTNLGSAAI